MNEQELHQLWQQMLAGEEHDRQAIAEAVQEDAQLLQALVDEQEVDALLQVMARPAMDTLADDNRPARRRDRPPELAQPSTKSTLRPPTAKRDLVDTSRSRLSRSLAGMAAAVIVASLLFLIINWPSFEDPAEGLSQNSSPSGQDLASPDLTSPTETNPETLLTVDTPAEGPTQNNAVTNPANSTPFTEPNDSQDLKIVAANPAKSPPEEDSVDSLPSASSDSLPEKPLLPSGLSLVRLDGSAWQPEEVQRPHPNQLQIVTGDGKLVGDNGLEIAFVAPVELDFDSPGVIRLIAGQYKIDTSREPNQWRLETPLAELQPRRDSEFLIRVDGEQSLEAFVDRGKLTLDRAEKATGELPIELAERRMPQALVTAASDEALPTVVMAQGPRLFLGQVLFDGQSAPTARPEELAKLVQAFETNRKLGNAPRLAVWNDLAQQMQRSQRQAVRKPTPLDGMLSDLFEAGTDLPNKLLEPGANQQSNSDFQGSISINGQTQRFDSQEAFDRARRQLPGLPQIGNVPGLGEIPNLEGIANLPNGQADGNFGAEINLNGRRLRFTSPEQFKAFRRQLNLR